MLTEAVHFPRTVSSASSWLRATSTSRVLGLCLPSKERCGVPELPGWSEELTNPTSSWWDAGMIQGHQQCPGHGIEAAELRPGALLESSVLKPGPTPCTNLVLAMAATIRFSKQQFTSQPCPFGNGLYPWLILTLSPFPDSCAFADVNVVVSAPPQATASLSMNNDAAQAQPCRS